MTEREQKIQDLMASCDIDHTRAEVFYVDQLTITSPKYLDEDNIQELQALVRKYNSTFSRQAWLASQSNRILEFLYDIAIVAAWFAGGFLSLRLCLDNPKYGILLPYLYLPLTIFSLVMWNRAKEHTLNKWHHFLIASIALAVIAYIFVILFTA